MSKTKTGLVAFGLVVGVFGILAGLVAWYADRVQENRYPSDTYRTPQPARATQPVAEVRPARPKGRPAPRPHTRGLPPAPDQDEAPPEPAPIVIPQPRPPEQQIPVADPPAGQRLKVTGNELGTAFSRNPVEARARYTGRWLDLDDVVESVVDGTDGTAVKTWGLYPGSIRCVTPAAQLTGLKPTMKLTLVGFCSGMRGRPEPSPADWEHGRTWVLLTRCTVTSHSDRTDTAEDWLRDMAGQYRPQAPVKFK